jgi:hypothetical protein
MRPLARIGRTAYALDLRHTAGSFPNRNGETESSFSNRRLDALMATPRDEVAKRRAWSGIITGVGKQSSINPACLILFILCKRELAASILRETSRFWLLPSFIRNNLLLIDIILSKKL